MSAKIFFERKLYDTHAVPPRGAVDQHWHGKLLNLVFSGKRKKEISTSFKFYDPDFLVKHFGLKAIEFGNWLNQQDRYVYMTGAAFAMLDFCTITGIKPVDFGLGGKITIAFGARGHTRSLAHFEPHTWAINLTRHRRYSLSTQERKYLTSNGAGSLGHEYGHALDFMAGRYLDKNGRFNFATQSICKVTDTGGGGYQLPAKPKNKIQAAALDLMVALCYDKIMDDGEIATRSKWYQDLFDYVKKTPGMGPYWTTDIEVFARSFEVFLYAECERKGISESFLKKTKYASELYPPVVRIKKIAPKFRKFIKLVYSEGHRTGVIKHDGKGC